MPIVKINSHTILTVQSLSSCFTLKIYTDKISKECKLMYVRGSIDRKRSVRQFNTAGFQFECTSHNVRTELNDAVLFMNIKSHHKRVNSNCVRMGGKLMNRLKEFVAAINVEPAWLLYFVGIGMFYMPSQVPI